MRFNGTQTSRWWLPVAIMWGVTLAHFVVSVGAFTYAIDAGLTRKTTGLPPTATEQLADLAWRVMQYPIAWISLKAPTIGQLVPPRFFWVWWFANSFVWGLGARLAYQRYVKKV